MLKGSAQLQLSDHAKFTGKEKDCCWIGVSAINYWQWKQKSWMLES